MNKATEQWLGVVGYEGIYEVSDHGNVRRILRTTGTRGCGPIKPMVKNNGYLWVYLRDSGRDSCAHVHRLVAAAFIPNPKGKPHVNHKDGTRTNNRAMNLEWVTPHENHLHTTRVLKRRTGSLHWNSKLTERDIPKIFAMRKAGLLHRQIAKECGVARSTIGAILAGGDWIHARASIK